MNKRHFDNKMIAPTEKEYLRIDTRINKNSNLIYS